MNENIGSYCCFWCPKGDNSPKALDDACPQCGRKFGFPLFNPPQKINEYKIEKSLGRGFYGATYVVTKTGLLPKKHVLKVIPHNLYSFFNKSFDDECRNHAEVAENASYITGIDAAFSAKVNFDGHPLDCHVAVLEYLDGELLTDYLSGKENLTSATASQIAADLFRIRNELEKKGKNHNDFHAGNIIVERLPKSRRREGAMDPGIRAVAIDLGSLAEDRRSGGNYKGDLHWMADHIDRMVTIVLSNDGEEISDIDARVGMRLRSVAQSILPSAEHQRTPYSSEIVKQIEEAYFLASAPWKPWTSPFVLRKFDDGYNAQTLEAWNVPRLLVDPDEKWQQAISASGPLVVTGMRGCGKTMLLRALQFHARAAQWENQNREDVSKRLAEDDFVGFFVSASALLSVRADSPPSINKMYARLVVAYSLEVARSLAHLVDIDPSAAAPQAVPLVKSVLTQLLNNAPDLENVVTVHQLERALVRVFNEACRSDSTIELSVHPSQSFPILADTVRQCSSYWSDSQVLFLLDDVSTRYLRGEQIQEILSALIFQSPKCAFKITSESQSIFLVLKSPGGIEPASHGRDFATFDLGSEVHERLKDREKGRTFLADILRQRARVFTPHPQHAEPEIVLGDCPLHEIAKTIALAGKTSKERKTVYHGISALRAVCVGDLGTAITIYDRILARASDSKFPVPPEHQANAFQNMCSALLYGLDRRESRYKSAAKSFAEASHKLLVQSALGGDTTRLRQYASIYVRVTSGDQEKQLKQLRDLVDAGVFVFQNGAARTKTKDSDPTHQFKLTFRRIYGLADYIGLSERDRFELSGPQLEEWLDDPSNGEEILTRNLKTKEPGKPSDPSPSNDYAPTDQGEDEVEPVYKQPDMFELATTAEKTNQPVQSETKYHLQVPTITELKDDINDVDLLVLALGFEERALESAKKSLDTTNPKRVLAIKYEEQIGHAEEIRRLVSLKGIPLEEVNYSEFIEKSVPIGASSIAVDVTGMTKAAIFLSLATALKRVDEVTVIYTEAEAYFPREEELNQIIQAAEDDDQATLLSKLKGVLTGETPPYRNELLANTESDGTRMKALFAQGSAKHERLIHLVESRDYNYVKVLVDSSQSARATVAKRAAEVAVINSGSIEECDIRDPNAVLASLKSAYENLYLEEGLNFEIGLTGDKVEAIAISAFASRIPVNRIYYVKPRSFDPAKFSKGFGKTRIFSISH